MLEQRRARRFGRHHVLAAIAVAVFSSGSSCKTEPEIGDTTPPTFEFTVQNRTTGQSTTYPGGGIHHAAYGDDLLITACAIDSGGLKSITTTSNSSFTCNAGNIGQSTGPGLAVPQTQNLGLDSNGEAWSRFCTFQNPTLTFPCSSGFTFSSGSVGSTIAATNYANLSGNAALGIRVP